jgi:hypothetical protein
MTDELNAFVSLYVQDVQEHPDAYKAAVRNNPEHAARVITNGLSRSEVGMLYRDLKRERRAVARR